MISPEVEGILASVAHTLNPPQPTTKVYKDECMYCFDTPETETGLYVCLKTFRGLGKAYLDKHVATSGNITFLHFRRIKHKKEKPATPEGAEKKVTRLAIGIEGGFKPENGVEYEVEEVYSLVVFPGHHIIKLPNDAIPQKLQVVIAGVISAESARRAAELEALSNTWDGEMRQVSVHSEILEQLHNGKKVSPRGWRCEAEGCDKVDNLWLNLTDGSILCGRKMFDGSGGNNHALDHYAVVKYPLAVKLGTITSEGKADVFSYDEDDMVFDTKLVDHLAHFGINVAQMEKTEKSMAEMEIELNIKHLGEINALTESGKTLKPMRGPGVTGIVNLGNSCYMNSLVQALFNIPEFQERFAKNAEKYFEISGDPTNDFNAQMSKLCMGLLSGKYAKKVDDDENSDAQIGVAPYAFKALVGKGHPEFSTKKQQDAQEFFLHIINVLEKHSRNEPNPANCFKFQVEDKLQCNDSKCVRYSQRMEYCLPLPIPLEAATNKEEFKEYEKKKAEALENKTTLTAEETVRLKIPLDACIEAFIARETLEPFYSNATDDLDLSVLRAKGLQPDELEFPPDESNNPPDVEIDESVAVQLEEMGFHPNACRKAVISSGNCGAEVALNWIMQHMNDPDLNDPPAANSGSRQPSNFVADEQAVASIQNMGFTPAQAKKALQATDNNVERAVDGPPKKNGTVSKIIFLFLVLAGVVSSASALEQTKLYVGVAGVGVAAALLTSGINYATTTGDFDREINIFLHNKLPPGYMFVGGRTYFHYGHLKVPCPFLVMADERLQCSAGKIKHTASGVSGMVQYDLIHDAKETNVTFTFFFSVPFDRNLAINWHGIDVRDVNNGTLPVNSDSFKAFYNWTWKSNHDEYGRCYQSARSANRSIVFANGYEVIGMMGDEISAHLDITVFQVSLEDFKKDIRRVGHTIPPEMTLPE